MAYWLRFSLRINLYINSVIWLGLCQHRSLSLLHCLHAPRSRQQVLNFRDCHAA